MKEQFKIVLRWDADKQNYDTLHIYTDGTEIYTDFGVDKSKPKR